MKKSIIKKIIYLSTTFGMGGAETFGKDLLVSLTQAGIKTIAYTNYQPFATNLVAHQIKTHLLPPAPDFLGDWKGLIKSSWRSPLALIAYWQVLTKNKDADLVLLSGFAPKIFLTPLAIIKKMPVVWFEFGSYGKTILKFWQLPKFLYYLVKNLPQTIIIPTEHSKKALMDSLHLSLAKIQIIPCGSNIKITSAPTTKKNSNLQKIVCLSRFEANKGQDILVKAFHLVCKTQPKTKLVLLGDDQTVFAKQIKNLVSKLGLKNKVEFKGYVDSVAKEIALADICVFPSVWQLEGFGLVQIEAMAQAKPLIAFNRGPSNEIIINNKTGLLIDKVGDHKALAEGLAALLKNKHLAKKLGLSGRQSFIKHYQFKNLINDYLKSFEWTKTKSITWHQRVKFAS